MIQIRSGILLFCFLLELQYLYAQSKKITDNTAAKDIHQELLLKKLRLSDLKESDHEHTFRFWGIGQTVDITRDSTLIVGEVTNYIYHQKKTSDYRTDTLYQKAALSPEQAKAAYDLFMNLKYRNIPTDEKVKGWSKGFDGITYCIEQADKTHYSTKSYWTPSIQDGILEAKVISDFVKSLSDTLKLEESFQSFKNTLPRQGCYHTGGLAVTCYVSNNIWAGYSASTKLPYGFYANYHAGYVGGAKVNLGASVQYNFNTDGMYHLNAALVKGKIFYENTNLTDYITYNYQKRKISIKNAIYEFENHQLMYGLQLKNNFKFEGGIDYLRKEDNMTGAYLSVSKWFAAPNINASFSTSLFEGQTNYKVDLSKSIHFNSRFFAKGLSFGIRYEDFMRYKDVYINIGVLL